MLLKDDHFQILTILINNDKDNFNRKIFCRIQSNVTTGEIERNITTFDAYKDSTFIDDKAPFEQIIQIIQKFSIQWLCKSISM